jgi:NitT/TauT family transport system permease protein
MKKILGVVILIVIWQIGSMLTMPLFIPSPLSTLEALIGLIQTDQLLPGLLYSFSRISIATIMSTAISIPLALLIYAVKPLKEMISPVVSAMRYIPVTAFSPLLILWFGIDETMKIAFLFLATFVYVLPSTILCLEDVPQDLIDTGKSIGMKAHEIIFEILLPAALPSIMNSILMMYGIGWTYVAVVEETNAIKGLGFIINVGSARGKTAIVFAAIIVIIIFSYIFDKLGNLLIHKAFKWRYMNNDNAE